METKFIHELKILFRKFQEDQESKNFCINGLRRELFKITYKTQMFELNQKGDTAEAMIKFLELIHVTLVKPSERAKAKTFED